MSAIKTYTPDTLAKEIKSAVEWLKEEDCGCVTLKLNGTLAVCVGWSDGFDPDDKTVIHSKTSPTWAICAAIKAWGSDDWNDSLVYSADVFYYVPLGLYPSFFKAQYKDMNEIVEELKSEVGKYMPEGYDYRVNIRHIVGTYFG